MDAQGKIIKAEGTGEGTNGPIKMGLCRNLSSDAAGFDVDF